MKTVQIKEYRGVLLETSVFAKNKISRDTLQHAVSGWDKLQGTMHTNCK